jgi:hypothetical protein
MKSETHSLLLRLVRGLLIGFGLFALGALVQVLLIMRGVSGASGYADDLILGSLAGLLVFAYEQKRHNAMLKRIRVIADLNHHVRNALQAITLSSHAQNAQQIEVIDESSNRIQWALRELLPQMYEDGNVPSVDAFQGSAEETPQSAAAAAPLQR